MIEFSVQPPLRERARRVPLDLSVRYRARSRGWIAGRSASLSAGGLFIEADESLPLGTKISFEVSASDSSAVRGTGVVSWLRADPTGKGGGGGFGVHFDSLNDQTQRQILSIMEAYFRGQRPEAPTVSEPEPRKRVPLLALGPLLATVLTALLFAIR